VVWYLQLTWGEGFTAGFSAIPFEITHGIDLLKPSQIRLDGQVVTIPQAPGPSPIYATVFTSMFMHGSWMHIIGNMVYLYIFGDQIEDELGHLPFLFFYLVSGLVAAGAHILVAPDSVIPCVGASGAIAGVLGAYLVLHPTNHVQVLVFRSIVRMPALIVLGMWGVLQVFGQMSASLGQHSGVAYMAHIGGFVVGVVCGILMRLRSKPRMRPTPWR
jgi:membrane associated rhomboid family serine protease